MPGTDAPGIPAALGFGQQVSWCELRWDGASLGFVFLAGMETRTL